VHVAVRLAPVPVRATARSAGDGDYEQADTMNRMRNAIAVTAAFAAAAAVVPAATPARPLTTTPGVIYTLKTPVDDTGIHMVKDKFTKNGITRYPRGAQLQYVFINKGTKP